MGVRNAVLCPGSRCAPLLIGFGQHKKINAISVTDERSAGFIGLGIAQQSGTPVVLVCTSGTAGQNFAPAVTEAFYQNVPLIILTADRPVEWIDQWDGQTIHQQSLYAEHIRGQFDFVPGKAAFKKAETLLRLSLHPVPGPVHINIPIRKPFYPKKLGDVQFPVLNITPFTRSASKISETSWNALDQVLQSSKKLLLIAGQQRLDKTLLSDIYQLGIPLMGDIISNTHPNNYTIPATDSFFDIENNSIRPDVLITIGRSVISEKLKHYFRKYKPENHWHIGRGMIGDPFQSITVTIQARPRDFFATCLKRRLRINDQTNWQKQLKQRHKQVHTHVTKSIRSNTLNQFIAIQIIMNALPKKNITLHLGNSMPVRVANIVGIKNSEIEVFSNRGTSGIDGILSTAVGHALAEPTQLHTLIIGDLAFFYDRNGFWLNQPFPDNLKTIVMNNKGGGIFSILPGPSDQEELLSLFATPQQRSIQLTAEEFSLNYFLANSLASLKGKINTFLASPKASILEILIQPKEDKHIFSQLNNEAKK
jgi:2-succinyl-5-enolpyruvyl-6-hydroxy-3-cyclohexene-1-carboxylate synthase